MAFLQRSLKDYFCTFFTKRINSIREITSRHLLVLLRENR
jgi:hypothetical protein